MLDVIAMGFSIAYGSAGRGLSLWKKSEKFRVKASKYLELKNKIKSIELQYGPKGFPENWLWKAVKASKFKDEEKLRDLNDFVLKASGQIDIYITLNELDSIQDNMLMELSYHIVISLVTIINPNFFLDPNPSDLFLWGYLNELKDSFSFLDDNKYIQLNCCKEYRDSNGDWIGTGFELLEYLMEWVQDDTSKLTLLGDFGSGKSWTLYILSKKLLRNGWYPFLIPLRRLRPAVEHDDLIKSILDYIQNWMPKCSVEIQARNLEKWVKRNDVIFIFDGFDEYASKIIGKSDTVGRSTLGEHLIALLNLHHLGCRVLVSSRPTVFKNHTELVRFLNNKFSEENDRYEKTLNVLESVHFLEEVKKELNVRFIQPFGLDQARLFLRSREALEFEEIILGSNEKAGIYNLQELSRTPIYLELITGNLQNILREESRSNVYAVDLYVAAHKNWKDWLGSKGKSPKDIENITSMCGIVARKMLMDNIDIVPFDNNLLPKGVTKGDLRTGLEYNKAGMMAWEDGENLGFLHRSFQEFYQAIELVSDVIQREESLITKKGDNIESTVLRFVHELYYYTENKKRFMDNIADWIQIAKEKNVLSPDNQKLICFVFKVNEFSYEYEQTKALCEDRTILPFWREYHDKEIEDASRKYDQMESLRRNFIHPLTKIEFELIPPGKAILGGIGEDDISPYVKKFVHPLYVSKYPITNEQYNIYMGANRRTFEPKYWEDSRYNNPSQPVVGISWFDANDFAKWAGFRLPTEDEWEYACRGGTSGLPYGELNEIAMWGEERVNIGTPYIGQKEPNFFNLYDMLGNVWEWCGGDYSIGDNMRILRGGSWYFSPKTLRPSSRYMSGPRNRKDFIGFRVVMDVKR